MLVFSFLNEKHIIEKHTVREGRGMGNEKPKFAVGDMVVVERDGTLSMVQKIFRVDGGWFYKLNNYDDLISEKNLALNKTNDFLKKRENVYIQYKFRFGDIVRVKGYGQDLFIVIGFRAEIWRYKESAWEDIIYELAKINDGQWLEASEEELTYITNEENAKKLINGKKKNLAKNPLPLSSPKLQGRQKEMADIDRLLDMYNDYYYLYQNFGEANYRKKMKEILKKLEAMSQNPFKNNFDQ